MAARVGEAPLDRVGDRVDAGDRLVPGAEVVALEDEEVAAGGDHRTGQVDLGAERPGPPAVPAEHLP